MKDFFWQITLCFSFSLVATLIIGAPLVSIKKTNRLITLITFASGSFGFALGILFLFAHEITISCYCYEIALPTELLAIIIASYTAIFIKIPYNIMTIKKHQTWRIPLLIATLIGSILIGNSFLVDFSHKCRIVREQKFNGNPP